MALMGLKDFADHYPEASLGRHAPAPRARPRLRGPARVPAHGRAVRRARRADAHCHAGPAAEVLASEGKTVLLVTHSVDEAIYLSSRIVVVTARPARVRTIIDVPFSYPRHESVHEDYRFAELRARIRGLVMEEYEAQAKQAVRRGSLAAAVEDHRRTARPITTTQETTMTLRRRTVLQAGAAAGTAALAGFAGHAFAQARTKLRVGYLHTPAVDGQIWLGQQSGAWTKRGLDMELIQFTTGLELFQAMIGGSLDVLSTGAVVSNFPARGQGRVFLLNNIEYATAQLWVRDDCGQVDRRPEGQADRDDDRHHRARLPRPRPALGQARPDQGRADRQPAHGRGGDLVRLGCRARGRALGAVRPDREAEGRRTRARWSTRRRSSRRRRSWAAGPRATTSTTPTSRPWRRSSPAGSRSTTRCSPTSTAPPRRCRRRSTRTSRSPTSATR